MQTFAKSKIALAVGTSLMVMAGVAQAAVPAGDPIARVLNGKPVLATPALQANADALYGATGFAGTLPVTMNFTAPADSVTPNFAILTGGADGLKVNAANTLSGATSVGASVATDDIVVYAGALGATQINLVTAAVGFASNAANVSAASANFSIVTTGDAALRMNPTTGALEYTTDNTTLPATPIVWLPVSIAVQVPAQTGTVRNAITASDSTDVAPLDHEAATSTVIAAIAGQSIFNTVAPTATAKTRATGALVDGVVLDTVTPLSAVIVVGSATTGLTFMSNVAGCSPAVGDANNAADIAAVAPAAPATGLTTAIAGSLNTITFVGATTDWTTGDATVDSAAYVSNCFNTGIASGTLPFIIDVTGTLLNKPTYSLVFNALGGPQVLAALPTIDDGANPVVTAAVLGAAPVAPATTQSLSLTFSEQVSLRTGDANGLSLIREVAENVLVGSNSIAALNLNAGGNITLSDSDGIPNGPTVAALGAGQNIPLFQNTAGQSTLVIDGLLATDLAGQTITVNSGIALQESNDTGFNSAVPALDLVGPLSGGVFSFSATSAIESSSVIALATTTPPVTIAFGDTTASAATTTADATKIGLITVSFPTGKGVGFNTGKTFANLTGQIVVTVTGNSAAGDPVTFDFFPTAIASGAPAAGQMVLSTSTAGSANTLIINPPTDLIYSKITAPIAGDVFVTYLNLDNLLATNVLVGTIAAAPVVAAGQEEVSLPLTAEATTNTLLTQSITGTLIGASSGSLVKAFLATWIDNPTGHALTANITSGRITNPGDKVATDLAIEFENEGALEGLIASALNPTLAKPAVPGVSEAIKAGSIAPIPVYVKLVRSNDLPSSSKGVAASSSGSGNGQNYLEARAILSTTYAGARGVQTANEINGIDGEDPIYEVNLDPRTGNITGRLTGNVRITQGSSNNGDRGLNILSPTPNATGLVDGTGRFNLLVGLDPDTAEIAAKAPAGAFVLLVHEDQANARRFTQLTSASPGAVNFVPFDPNLYNLKGTRTVLGAAPGIAAPFVGTGTAPSINLANYLVNDVGHSGNWMLMGLRNPAFSSANSAPGNFPRHFVGIDHVTGIPSSFWTNDGSGDDMALALNGNRMSLATELGGGGTTLTTFGSSSAVPGAVAWAWNNDVSTVNDRLTFAQAPTPSAPVRVPRGWSLVTVPTGGLTTASIDAVMKVGFNATGTQFTWIKSADGALPSLTPGEGVFVFSNAGGGNL